MGARWIRRWEGGRVREVDGREVWVIERKYGGARYTHTLEVESERDALAELALFARAPAAYRTKRQVAFTASADEPVVLDAPTVAGFLAHLERGERSVRYRAAVRNYLAQWATAVGKRDLREVPTQQLRAWLAKWPTARKARIIVLKSFCSWLREEGRLTAAQDPAFELKVPPPRPEKAVRSKGYSIQFVERAYRTCWRQDVRDVLRLRAVTGMHHTEIVRLVSGGELRRLDDPSGIFGTIRFVHKSGRVHAVSLDAAAFAAAERLAMLATVAKGDASGKIRGVPSEHIVDQVCERIARRMGEPRFAPGELRHSFATWAPTVGREVRPVKAGVPMALVSAVMGHFSEHTTRTFYSEAIPPMVALPIRLEHPEDPVLNSPRGRTHASTGTG